MIRLRTPADLDACVKALAEVQAADRYPVDWPDDPHGWLTPGDLLRAWIALDEAGAVVGHVGLAQVEPRVAELLGTPVRASVTRLFVTPSARRGGLAARLLDTALAAEGGRLTLEVSDEGTAAIAAYERYGWLRVATSRARWRNSAGEPALVHHYLSP
ncbi:GNAT family N-acetyltransferase [Nonomuraea guangzhouensis]|uniref:GNAT family N-acetyltransferase n=1 Tax=Nonomuraea guangzhouensis TaxID=1291555 RepID=A0ABW4GQM3_9ACTN|nr:GNAT family N-acetyltransferase [Nonomuraea guangzhouensis]